MKRTMICLLLFMGQTLAQGAAQVVAVRAGHLVDPATASVTDNQLILVKDGKIVRKPD
jgi:imidazolonepropionase-like amidohydrolase